MPFHSCLPHTRTGQKQTETAPQIRKANKVIEQTRLVSPHLFTSRALSWLRSSDLVLSGSSSLPISISISLFTLDLFWRQLVQNLIDLFFSSPTRATSLLPLGTLSPAISASLRLASPNSPHTHLIVFTVRQLCNVWTETGKRESSYKRGSEPSRGWRWQTPLDAAVDDDSTRLTHACIYLL